MEGIFIASIKNLHLTVKLHISVWKRQYSASGLEIRECGSLGSL